MVSGGIVSTLAGQMLQAQARAADALAGGRDARPIEAVDRSLRQTLSCLVQMRDPREVAAKGFSLVVHATGEAVVRQGERILPVTDRHLRNLLEEAGVELVPGQVILLDPALVVYLVEEALWALSLREAEIRGAKSRLIQASLEAESCLPTRPHRTKDDGRDAA